MTVDAYGINECLKEKEVVEAVFLLLRHVLRYMFVISAITLASLVAVL